MKSTPRLVRLCETESFVTLGEMRYEIVITDDISIAFQPSVAPFG